MDTETALDWLSGLEVGTAVFEEHAANAQLRMVAKSRRNATDFTPIIYVSR